MTKKLLSFVIILATVCMFVYTGNAQEEGEPEFQYIGSKKCKMCHRSKKSGEQFPIWENSKHAKAYQTLATEESKKIAKEMGIENPQESDQCLSCHVTGYGKDPAMFEKSFSMEEGVGCEACHGPGSEYKSMRAMKQIYAGEVDGAEYGLLEPDAEQCKTCHNENSPTFKGFDFEKFMAKIAHPVPEEK